VGVGVGVKGGAFPLSDRLREGATAASLEGKELDRTGARLMLRDAAMS
jgi:hypothetical protein